MDNHAYSVTFFLSDFNWPRLFLFSRRRFIFLLNSELPGLDNDDAFDADAPNQMSRSGEGDCRS